MKNVTNNIQKSKSTAINSIGRPLDKCCVSGCTEEADIKILVAKNQKGFIVNAKEAANIIFVSGENVSLKTGYTFIRWVSRCCAHYAQDVQGASCSALQSAQRNHLLKNNDE